MDFRGWLRELVRPAKALTEYRRALAIAALGVPTVDPIAVGQAGAGNGPAESILITRSLTGSEALSRFLESTLPQLPAGEQTRIRQRLAVQLAALTARLHEHGIIHHDLHAGNLLVRCPDAGDLELFLIDVHAARIGPPLSWRARVANMVILNRWFSMRASRSDRLRFWMAYVAACGSSIPVNRAVPAADCGRRIEEQTWASNLRFWRHRDARCLRNNRYYQRLRSSAAAGFAVRDLDSGTRQTLLDDPDAPFRVPGAKVLKDSPSSTVVEFEMPIDGLLRPVIYKRFRMTSWTEPLRSLFRRPPALRSWINGHGLRERDLPTARPLLVLHRRRFGLLAEGYLLQEKIPDALDLLGFVARLADLPPDRRRPLLRKTIDTVAGLVRELHRRQLSHRDLKATNLLIQASVGRQFLSGGRQPPEGCVWLIDLVGMARYRKLPHSRKVQNLARLHVSFRENAVLTRTDKLRFLREYLQWGLFGKAGWKEWWREIGEATQAKLARNRRRGRPIG
jgi:serine/threonine protein kinase